MAAIATIKVEGFNDLLARLNELSDEISKQKTDRMWRTILERSAQPILDAVKQRAPKDTGQLAMRIYMKVRRSNARDKRSSQYLGDEYIARILASPLRDESTRHRVVTKRKKKDGSYVVQTVWRGKRPVAISQEFGNAKTPAQPFMRVGMRQARDQSIETMKMLLQLKIQELARSKARATSTPYWMR